MVTTVLLSLLMFRVVLNFIVSFPGDNEYYVDHCTTFTADFWGGFKHGDHCTTFTADVLGGFKHYVDHCTTFTADVLGDFKHYGDHCITFTADYFG